MPSLKTSTRSAPLQQQQPPPTAVSRRPPPRLSSIVSNDSQSPEGSPTSTEAANANVRIQITVTSPVVAAADCDQFAIKSPIDGLNQFNQQLIEVPLEIGGESFEELELTQQLKAIENHAADELRHHYTRQRRNEMRMRKCINKLDRFETSMTFESGRDDVTTTSASCNNDPNGIATEKSTIDSVISDTLADKQNCTNDTLNEDCIQSNPEGEGVKTKRFRLWFDVSMFDAQTVRVTFDSRHSFVEVSAALISDSTVQQYRRSVSVANIYPIDCRSLRAVHTSEGLLVVEGLTSPEGKTGRVRNKTRRHHRRRRHQKKRSLSSVVARLTEVIRRQRSSSAPVDKLSVPVNVDKAGNDKEKAETDDEIDEEGSAGADTEDNEDTSDEETESSRDGVVTVGKKPREKIGVATFHKDDDGIRRMKLIVDMGKAFKASDVVLQYLKQNKIQVWAKNQFKSEERWSKAKFNREYELTEKIECRSLTGRFDSVSGRLIVEAIAKEPSTSTDFPALISRICRGCIGWTAEDAEAAAGNRGTENYNVDNYDGRSDQAGGS